MTDLVEYASNIHSQFGEDGIINHILEVLGISEGWFCEFGAWDGKYLCNCRVLFEKGFKGVFIESDTEKFVELEENYKATLVETINRKVGLQGNSLDKILLKTVLPYDFDILSIDIDGNDYQIWESLEFYRPKVVVIESNHTFGYNIEFIQKYGEDCIGASALSLYKLGKLKNYTLVCYNIINCFFVRNDLMKHFNLNLNFPYLFHLGREKKMGGFFASDLEGNWSVVNNKIAWGFKNKRLNKNPLGRVIRKLLTLFDVEIGIVKFSNSVLQSKSQHFRCITNTQEIQNLWSENWPLKKL
jgi:hypothetical protein